MTKRLWSMLIPCVAISFLGSGCNDETSTVTPTSVSTDLAGLDLTGVPSADMAGVTPSPTPTPTPTGMVTTVTVGPNGTTSYSPSSVTIHAGDTVHWVWVSSGISHTVTSGSGGTADGQFCSNGGTASVAACATASYAATVGNTYDHTFSTAGTFPYFCEVHGAIMSGTVVVQ
jgi:plastocyanin